MSRTRPLPPHGSYARANGSPGYRAACKCDQCLPARRRHDKKWKVNRELGKPASVDATPAREHLALLRRTHTWRSLAAATGIAESNLLYIANGRRAEIHRDTHNSILAVQPGPTPVDHLQVDALIARRMLQALMAVGHSVRTLAQESQVSRDRVHDLAVGLQSTVRYDVSERIAGAYTRLAFRPPADNKYTARTRNLAAARGWHGPLAWDDICDPEATPETHPAYLPAARNGRDSMRMAEIEHLYLLGESPTSIAKKFDGSEKYVRDLIGVVIRRREARAEQERAAARAQRPQAVAA